MKIRPPHKPAPSRPQKPTAPQSTWAPKRATPRRRAGPLLILAAAAALSAAAGSTLHNAVLRLPLPRYVRLDQRRIEQAHAEVLRRDSEANAAGLLASLSYHFVIGLRDEAHLRSEALRAERERTARLSRSHLWRLQLAALDMLEAERSGKPPAAWWPVVREYVTGLDAERFGHGQRARFAASTAAFAALGVDRGQAMRYARYRIGAPHGPFLEFFTERMLRMATALAAGGDAASAQQCERLVRQLLRAWALEPGPVEIRLLAAALLANVLDPPGGRGARGDAALPIGSQPGSAATADPVLPEEARLATELRRWREAYRAAAAARPPGWSLLDWHAGPELRPVEARRLTTRLALGTWLGSATVAAAVVGVLIGWLWFARPAIPSPAEGPPGNAKSGRPPSAGVGAPLLRGAALAAVVVVGGLLWLWLAPAEVRADFRRSWFLQSDRYSPGWPRHPFIAAGLMIVLLAAVYVAAPRSGGSWRDRLTATAATASSTWLILAALWLTVAVATSLAQYGYDRAIAAALEDEYAAITGVAAEGPVMDALRRWQP